ncbi:hypothetical protein GPECTOR_24g273 [Gonium pectorale]|uniref:EF-hand domain-containing protein n=1 Tax=Gonium pectorale TaxID=33097 RepID=A0A150GGS1_GONPE|nr:hypothetical protein GPECTOR_24g273 [Gonium pectorale]|eukprot:KXZ48983.1 hypothetical protein GPECTOR_24g273 [Gonium pectorale]
MSKAEEGEAPTTPAGPRAGGIQVGMASSSVRVAEGGKDPKQMLRVQSIMKKVGGAQRSREVHAILEELDRDHDGTIDVAELIDMVEGIVKSRRERRYMWFVIIALFVFAACTIGTIIGLTYAVVNALKDTEVTGSVMYVKGSATDVVKVGSADFAVVNNVMVPRSAADAANPTNITSPTSVMQTAAFAGIRQPLSSRLPLETLFELKFLHIKGVGEAELGVDVNGVARVPLAGSVYGTVVRMITAAGTITLDGTVLTFSSQVADIFEEAGFRVSGSRRALVGDYYVFGFFNAIKDLEPFGLPSDQARPQLPDKNFRMSLKVYQPCTPPGAPGDLCAYAPPADSWDGTAAAAVVDIDGTETTNGVRWMTHHETLVNWEGMVRTETYFALYPGFRKVEVRGAAGSDQQISAWQEEYDEADPLVAVETMFCRTYGMPEGLQGAVLSDSVRNFTYLGVDTLAGGRLARHFQLTVAQQANLTGVVTVDYWDSADDRSPVSFAVDHPVLGELRMEVLDFGPLTAVSPQAQAALFAAPTKEDCPDRALVPQLASPFSVLSGSSLKPALVDGGSDGAAARRRATEVARFRRELAASGGCDGPTKTLYSGPLGPCTFNVDYMVPWHLVGRAECTAAIGAVSLTGTVSGNTCSMKVEGCLSVGLAITQNWLMSKMGMGNFYILKACALYDPSVNMPFIVRATLQWVQQWIRLV